MFLTGPRVVEAVTRERVTAEELGGPRVHARNGVAHLAADRRRARPRRSSATSSPTFPSMREARCRWRRPRGRRPATPPSPCRADPRAVYDVRDVAARLVDAGALLELAPRWARNLVVGFARIEGRPVGVVANQPRRLGGILDADASREGRVVRRTCATASVLALVVLVDTPGFLPGARRSAPGSSATGPRLLRAFAAPRVPRATVTLRQAYGGAHIVDELARPGRDLTLAWPGARIGVMGARQAVEVLERRSHRRGRRRRRAGRRLRRRALPGSDAAAARLRRRDRRAGRDARAPGRRTRDGR